MNRKVKYVRLHEAVYIPGLGDMGPVLPNPHKVIPGFAMVATSEGIELFAKECEAFIPWPNVKICVFEEAVKEKGKEKDKEKEAPGWFKKVS